VLYQLIRDPGHQIFSKHQALSNLKSILLEVGNDEADHQELQLVTMEIPTELTLDLSVNLTDEIKKRCSSQSSCSSSSLLMEMMKKNLPPSPGGQWSHCGPVLEAGGRGGRLGPPKPSGPPSG
jgi:hypothetical protein